MLVKTFQWVVRLKTERDGADSARMDDSLVLSGAASGCFGLGGGAYRHRASLNALAVEAPKIALFFFYQFMTHFPLQMLFLKVVI